MGLMNSINDVSANSFRNNDLFTFENKANLDKFISERKNNTELHEEGRLCILAILIAWCMSMHFMPTSSSAASLIFLIFASDLYMKLIWSVSKTLVFFTSLSETGKYDLLKVSAIHISAFFLYTIWYSNFWNFNSIRWGLIGATTILFLGIISRGLKSYSILIWLPEV